MKSIPSVVPNLKIQMSTTEWPSDYLWNPEPFHFQTKCLPFMEWNHSKIQNKIVQILNASYFNQKKL
jgi:hypothetical protein